MAIPSKEDFDDCLKCLSEFHADELKSKYTRQITILTDPELTITPTIESVSEFLESLKEILDRKVSAVISTKVYKWLNDQEAYKRAFKSAFRLNVKETSSSDDNMVQHYLRYFETITEEQAAAILNFGPSPKTSEIEVQKYQSKFNEESTRLKRFHREIKASMDFQHGKLLYDIIHSLKIYYYYDVEKYINFKKEQLNLAKDTKKSIDKLLLKFNTDSEYEIYLNNKSSWFKSLKRSSIEIEEMLIFSKTNLTPIERKGPSQAERLLVYNLWRAFKKEFEKSQNNSSKSTSISHFLSLEGISNPIELGAIEKLIKKWNKQYKASELEKRNQREYIESLRQVKKLYRVM